ncbi:ROK family protein [Paracoccus sp. (in: a-proteobacteria)]|uniref:ROK family protein n=1 Tax=Paracoccus sp. TaxID=267 RepID=UPI003A85DACE
MMAVHAIGVDVGGTKIRGALVDLANGTLIAVHQVPTPPRGTTPDAATVVRAMIARLATGPQRPVGIGIGLPELVTNEGSVESDWVLDWRGLDPQSLADGGIPVILDSDVRCGARAELRFGAGRALSCFSYVSIGTGCSAVQCIDGRIHRGACGFAIHFGSSDLVSIRDTGGTGAFNLEARASGQGIGNLFAARGGGHVPTHEIMRRRQKDPIAQQVLLDAAQAMASYLGQMVNLLDPEALILGGGLGLSADYRQMLIAELPRFIWARARRNIPVLAATTGPDAGVTGAACLFGPAADTPSGGGGWQGFGTAPAR